MLTKSIVKKVSGVSGSGGGGGGDATTINVSI